MTKNIKFVITRFDFFQAQNAPKSVLPFPSALARTRRLGSQAPLNTKSWLRQCTEKRLKANDYTMEEYRVTHKIGTRFYALTLPTINRFSKLFHCQTQETICNNTIADDFTTPHVCRYTTL